VLILSSVIGSVGFGTTRSFSGAAATQPPEGFYTTSITSVLTVVNNLPLAVFLPTEFLFLPFMPKIAKDVGNAKIEFPLHLKMSITEERRSPGSKSSLINSLVRLADDDKSATAKMSKTSNHLTEDEIVGNLFFFTAAGFDTTANTLTFAIMALALHPDLQDWIIEEIDQASSTHPDAGYSETFSVLTRCLALMVTSSPIPA
jgi:hypothetical protein